MSEPDYMAMSKYQRSYRRKKGIEIPRKPTTLKGRKQSPEHVASRLRSREASANWIFGEVSASTGRARALREYRELWSCEMCDAEKTERHHVDGNPTNNKPSNIACLCRRCHTALHKAQRKAMKAAWKEVGETMKAHGFTGMRKR